MRPTESIEYAARMARLSIRAADAQLAEVEGTANATTVARERADLRGDRAHLVGVRDAMLDVLNWLGVPEGDQ